MKKVITMVGTSIFYNYLNDNSNNNLFKIYIDNLENKDSGKYCEEERRIKEVKGKIREWMTTKKTFQEKENISAEIKSLAKLKEELKEELEIYLLSSDTLLGIVASELIEDFIIKQKEMFNLYPTVLKKEVIRDLQVWDRKKFENGMKNLVYKIYEISNGFWGNIVINITGGFKAIIPFLSTLGQINRCPVYYIFEGTDALIKIPNIPINIDWEIFKRHEKLFMEIERDEVKELPDKFEESELENIKAIVEYVDNLITFNPLGLTLWKKYKESFHLFYISPMISELLQVNEKKRILENSLLELKKRLIENPEHPDLDHKLQGIDLKSFKCFKHKEDNLQVRIIYRAIKWKTQYGSDEIDIYIGDAAIGSEVHNAESEYIKQFSNNLSKIENLELYESYRIVKK